MGRGAWHATVRAATKSQTQLSTTYANGGAGSRKMINAGRQASERRAVPTTRLNATKREVIIAWIPKLLSVWGTQKTPTQE